MRWPEGPPHLALNPPYLFFLFVFFFFLFFLLPFLSLFLIEKPVLPLKRAIFWFIFSVSLSFSLNLFWPPPFSLSLSLSLCFALVFLSSFLSFFFGFLFLSCFCLFFFVLSSVLLFLEKNNMKILNWNFFSSSKCSLFCVSCLVFSLKSLFLIFVFFLILSYVFCSTSLFLVSKNPSWKTPILGQKGGCNITGFFINLCFAKCQKLSFFVCQFFGQFFLIFQKHTIKIGISAHFSKQKITKKWHFWKLLSGPSWKLLSGPSWLRLKKRQLGPDNNFQNCCAQILFPKKKGWNPYFYSVFWQSVF